MSVDSFKQSDLIFNGIQCHCGNLQIHVEISIVAGIRPPLSHQFVWFVVAGMSTNFFRALLVFNSSRSSLQMFGIQYHESDKFLPMEYTAGSLPRQFIKKYGADSAEKTISCWQERVA
jgi:hypothetical protein